MVLYLDGCHTLSFQSPKEWTPVKLHVDTDSGIGGFTPLIALDHSGNALAVWIERNGTGQTLSASWYRAGTGWQASFPISEAVEAASDYRLAIDDLGNAIVVWVQHQSDDTMAVLAGHCRSDARCDSPVRIGSGGTTTPALAIDHTGNAAIVWKQIKGKQTLLLVRRYSPDSGWSGDHVITSIPGPVLGPEISMNSNSETSVVWSQWEGGKYRAMAVSYAPAQGWTRPLALDDNLSDSLNPQVAMSEDSSAVSLWRQFDGSDYRIHACYRPAGGKWGSPAILERQTGDSVYPRVAIDHLGNAVAVWVQRHCPQRHCLYSHVWSSRYNRQTGWSEPTLLSSRGFDIQIAIDDNTNAVAVWAESVGLMKNRSVIAVSRYRPDTGWNRVSALDIRGDSVHPAFATRDSRIAIVWEQFLSGHREIWGVVSRNPESVKGKDARLHK